MNKKNKNIIIIFGFCLIITVFLNSQTVFAQYGLENAANIGGLPTTNISEIVAKVVDVVLGFLGLIFVVLIIIGGFQWMTSAGSPEKVKSAKSLLTNATIGLLVILAAWGIAQFVFSLMGIKTIVG